MLPEYFEFQAKTKIVFRNGAVEEAGSELGKLGAERPFLIIDPFFRDGDFHARLRESIESAGLTLAGVKSDIPQDSDIGVCAQGAEEARAADADSLIAVGGGSVLDSAKAINILLTEGGDLLDDHQGAYLQTRPLRPFVAVPTTAGTGSEITSAAVIKHHEEHIKVSFVSPFFAFNTALLDPEITAGMPPALTASTGMDALTHAVEAMHSTGREPWADALALEAIRMIDQWIEKAASRGDDLEARGNMLIASNMAGAAFSNALVGIVHAAGHAAGGVASVPHGVAMSILLPFGMEFNMEVCAEVYARIGRVMGLEGGSDEELARAAVARVRDLARNCGLPAGLGQAGVTEEMLPELAAAAIGDGAMISNPVFPDDEEQLIEFYKQAL